MVAGFIQQRNDGNFFEIGDLDAGLLPAIFCDVLDEVAL